MLNGSFVSPSTATKLVREECKSLLQKAKTSMFSQGVYRSFFIPPFFPSFPTAQNLASCNDSRGERAAFLNTHTHTHTHSLTHSLSRTPAPSFSSPYLSRVTASRCCVRVSSAGPVWSGCVVSSSTESLLTGWMRESNIVYFNLFRMPELCPEFLLSLIPQLAVSIPRSCSAL